MDTSWENTHSMFQSLYVSVFLKTDPSISIIRDDGMIFFMASPTYWSDCSEGLKQYGTLIVHLHRPGHKSKPIPGLVTDLWFYFFVTLFQNDRGNMIWFFSMESSSNFLANLVQINSAMFATTDFTFAFFHTLKHSAVVCRLLELLKNMFIHCPLICQTCITKTADFKDFLAI